MNGCSRSAAAHDHGPLARTLLRLRHDFVMIGRASIAPLPQSLRARLEPLLTRSHRGGNRVPARMQHFSRAPARFAVARAIDAAFDGYTGEVATLRREGATHALPEETVEHFFMLGFVLEQVRDHFKDLARCIDKSPA